MESEIRAAVAKMKPGDCTTAGELAKHLGLDVGTTGIWLDVLAGEDLLIREHRSLQWTVHDDVGPDTRFVQYRRTEKS